MMDVTKLLNSRRIEVNIADIKIDKDFVHRFRVHNHIPRAALANMLGVSKRTVENWERGVNNIKGSSAVLLKLLNDNPGLIDQLCVVKQEGDLYET